MAQSSAIAGADQLVAPTDDITANSLSIWKNSPPLYHDLKFNSYIAYDVREWSGRLLKYKAEAVAYAERSKRVEEEVAKLHALLTGRTEKVSDLDQRFESAQQINSELEQQLKEELKRCSLASSECLQLRKGRQLLQKQRKQIENEIAQTLVRIGNLKTEVDQNREKHLAALGEKEKLKLERQWFFRERLLLEETTNTELRDIGIMREKLEKLRHCLHLAWKDAKELDFLGHLRATGRMAFSSEWYAARKRLQAGDLLQ